MRSWPLRDAPTVATAPRSAAPAAMARGAMAAAPAGARAALQRRSTARRRTTPPPPETRPRWRARGRRSAVHMRCWSPARATRLLDGSRRVHRRSPSTPVPPRCAPRVQPRPRLRRSRRKRTASASHWRGANLRSVRVATSRRRVRSPPAPDPGTPTRSRWPRRATQAVSVPGPWPTSARIRSPTGRASGCRSPPRHAAGSRRRAAPRAPRASRTAR